MGGKVGVNVPSARDANTMMTIATNATAAHGVAGEEDTHGEG